NDRLTCRDLEVDGQDGNGRAGEPSAWLSRVHVAHKSAAPLRRTARGRSLEHAGPGRSPLVGWHWKSERHEQSLGRLQRIGYRSNRRRHFLVYERILFCERLL